MAVDASTIKALREKTGVGMMDCKRALVEAGGDMEEAVKVLRKKGIATAQKKSSRAASEGLIHSCIAGDGKSGVMVEVSCETDFVARTDDYVALVNDLAERVLDSSPSDNESFLSSSYDGSKTVNDFIIEKIAKLGENIQFRRFVRYQGDLIASYIHAGGKVGVLMELGIDSIDDDVTEVVKDLCMQVAASAPRFVSRDEVSDDILAAEREIYKSQVLAEGKPEKIVDKIVEGKMNKFYSENCLLEQAFVREPKISVTDYMKQKTGDRLKVVKFSRFVLGEGLPSSACKSE